MRPVASRHSLSLCIVFALVSPLLLTACGNPPGGPPPAEGTPVMGITTVKTQPVDLTTELPGRTTPYLIAEVRPQVSGIIQERTFREGADVKAGETLYRIDPATYKASYDNYLATLGKAQANQRSLRLKAERYKELITIKAVSQQDYDDTDAELGQANAEVNAAKANVESARITLAYTRVTAPISGRISKSAVTPGALVTDSQTTALTTIQQLDPIYVDVTQPSMSLLRLKRSMARGELEKSGESAARVRLMLEDGSQYPFEGRLEFSDVTVDQNTGSITLRAVFPNPQAELLPGMYVRAVLQEGTQQNGILIPQQAVSRNSAGKPVVYVVGKDSRLELRALDTDRTVGDQWLVRSGLQPGEQIVVDGIPRAQPGAEVKTTPWQPKAVTANAPSSAPASASN
nr:efflux RND transporter periplasmic adaptor subunit [Pseudomonas cichorii]